MLEATLQSSFVLLQSFETRFHSVDQCGLQVLILLPQFPSAGIIDVLHHSGSTSAIIIQFSAFHLVWQMNNFFWMSLVRSCVTGSCSLSDKKGCLFTRAGSVPEWMMLGSCRWGCSALENLTGQGSSAQKDSLMTQRDTRSRFSQHSENFTTKNYFCLVFRFKIKQLL